MPDLSHWTLDDALCAVLQLVLASWALWWALALLVAVVDPRLAARLGPPVLRVLLVGGVVVATAAPASARTTTPVGVLDGLPLPERPVTGAPPADPTPDTRPATATHVVQPGDSLWSIVLQRSPDASDAATAAAVTGWHRANRGVVGPDPDLIQPGQRLVPPGAP